jgi:hypothetical protein
VCCPLLCPRAADAQAPVLRYNLGPNGGILTALNLFTTKLDQVLEIVEKRAEDVEYVSLCRRV